MAKKWTPHIDPEELDEYIDHSNRIEREYSEEAFNDAYQAWNFLFTKPLTVRNILLSHKRLLRRLWPKYAGKFRDCDVWIGGNKKTFISEYLLNEQLQDWIDTYANHKVFENMCACLGLCKHKRDKSKLIEDAHIAFEFIHPFIDGNGRIGRIIMNHQRAWCGLPILIIHEGQEQMEYYKLFS